MSWCSFFVTWLIGIMFVVAQGIATYTGGYFSQSQMVARGITNGWSFCNHAGMYADIFIVSPVIAYIMSNYELSYFSKWGAWMFVAVTILTAATLP